MGHVKVHHPQRSSKEFNFLKSSKLGHLNHISHIFFLGGPKTLPIQVTDKAVPKATMAMAMQPTIRPKIIRIPDVRSSTLEGLLLELVAAKCENHLERNHMVLQLP